MKRRFGSRKSPGYTRPNASRKGHPSLKSNDRPLKQDTRTRTDFRTVRGSPPCLSLSCGAIDRDWIQQHLHRKVKRLCGQDISQCKRNHSEIYLLYPLIHTMILAPFGTGSWLISIPEEVWIGRERGRISSSLASRNTSGATGWNLYAVLGPNKNDAN